MFDAPTTVARIPRNAIPYSLARRMTPNGVQGRRRGRFCASNPVLTGWNPSTSLAGSIESMTRLVSTPFPSGNCTRIPSTRSSRLSLLTRSSSCASLVAAGRSCAKDSMPTSRDALRLLRTYTEDAGSWPTCTTANPGRRPCLAANSLARAATACCTRAATALPSSTTAVPDGGVGAGSLLVMDICCSVPIVVRLVRTRLVDADVARLGIRQLGKVRVELPQLQPRDLLIEGFREHVHAECVLRGVREELDLRERLVGEARAHHVARVARAATQVHQAPFGQQNQPLAVGEDDVVDLRLDVLPRILLEARHV